MPKIVIISGDYDDPEIYSDIEGLEVRWIDCGVLEYEADQHDANEVIAAAIDGLTEIKYLREG